MSTPTVCPVIPEQAKQNKMAAEDKYYVTIMYYNVTHLCPINPDISYSVIAFLIGHYEIKKTDDFL